MADSINLPVAGTTTSYAPFESAGSDATDGPILPASSSGAPSSRSRSAPGTGFQLASAAGPGASRSSFVASHRDLISDLKTAAGELGFEPFAALRSALGGLGEASGLFEVPMSPRQRVAVLIEAYEEAVDRYEAGDPTVSREIVSDLFRAANNEITEIGTGQARTRALAADIGAGTMEFVRGTSVGLTAGLATILGGPAAGALSGGLQSLVTLGAMAGSAAAQGLPMESLSLPQRMVNDVGTIFTTLAGPKLLAFFGLPGAPTANTMRAIAANMGRQGAVDGALDGLFTTVVEASVNGRPIPEALRAGAVQGAMSLVLSAGFTGPLSALDARQQSNLAGTIGLMTDAEAVGMARSMDPRLASNLRNEAPIVYDALNTRLGGRLDELAEDLLLGEAVGENDATAVRILLRYPTTRSHHSADRDYLWIQRGQWSSVGHGS